MSTLAVKLTWDRLGRKDPANARRDGYEEIVSVGDLDDLAETIYRIARRWLLSSDFAIHVHDAGNRGTFSIEADRYGKGRWEVVTEVHDGACTCDAQFVDPRCARHGAHEYHGAPT